MQVVILQRCYWADWDAISEWRKAEIRMENFYNEITPYSLVDHWKIVSKQTQKRRNSIKKPLLQLLNEFDRIARKKHKEIGPRTFASKSATR